MKKSSLSYLVIFIAISIFFSSCNALKKMIDRIDEVTFAVTPRPLEMHGNEVAFNIKITFPKEYFNKAAIITAVPVLKYNGGEVVLDKMEARGEDTEGNGTVINYENGGSVTLSAKVPYQDAMRIATLEWKEMTGSYKKQTGDVPIPEEKKKLADGIITTPELVKKGLLVDNTYNDGAGMASVILATEPLVKVTDASFKATAYYKINTTTVTEKVGYDEFIKKIAEVSKNPKQTLKELNVWSYASVDGEERLNTSLAGNRTKEAVKYTTADLKKAGFEINNSKIVTNSTPEDWKGFEDLVKGSNIQDKDLILRVLSMYSDPSVREKEIKNLTAAFGALAETILPKLRKTEFTVAFTTEAKTTEQIVNLALSNPKELTQNELLFAGESCKMLDKKLEIYKAYNAAYPNDWRGANNIGVIYTYKRDYKEAKTYFESAKNLEDNATTANNLGFIELLNGKKDAAKQFFSSAANSSSSDAVNYNLGVISIMENKYSEAVKYFGGSKTFNAALAQLLDEDPNAGLNTIKSVESDNPYNYYLKAIFGAKTDNTTMLFDNLKTATDKDASLKNYAKKDMEFFKYFSNDTFKAIVN
jgi:tetratricopeptide (TPR) repeat protein